MHHKHRLPRYETMIEREVLQQKGANAAVCCAWEGIGPFKGATPATLPFFRIRRHHLRHFCYEKQDADHRNRHHALSENRYDLGRYLVH